MMVSVTFLGGAAAAHRGAHMSINEFLDKLKPQRRRWADAAVQGFTLVVLAVVLFYGLVVGLFVYRELTFAMLPKLFLRAACTTAAVMLIIGTAASCADRIAEVTAIARRRPLSRKVRDEP